MARTNNASGSAAPSTPADTPTATPSTKDPAVDESDNVERFKRIINEVEEASAKRQKTANDDLIKGIANALAASQSKIASMQEASEKSVHKFMQQRRDAQVQVHQHAAPGATQQQQLQQAAINEMICSAKTATTNAALAPMLANLPDNEQAKLVSFQQDLDDNGRLSQLDLKALADQAAQMRQLMDDTKKKEKVQVLIDGLTTAVTNGNEIQARLLSAFRTVLSSLARKTRPLRASGGGGHHSSQDRSHITCFKCNKKGHYASDCSEQGGKGGASASTV